jgi:hypothetical protein
MKLCAACRARARAAAGGLDLPAPSSVSGARLLRSLRRSRRFGPSPWIPVSMPALRA